MKVIVGCEESQVICKAFRAKGHEAYSCDIVPCSGGHPEWHIQDDVLNHLDDDWDLGIFHPECTYLTVTGNKWFKPEFKSRFPTREQDRLDAIDFFMRFTCTTIPKVAIENPVGIMSTLYQKPTQIIHPYYFGDPHPKKTCLWLKGLPKLIPTNIVEPKYRTTKSGKRMPEWGWYGMSSDPIARKKMRSVTFQGIAEAMATQWNFKE